GGRSSTPGLDARRRRQRRNRRDPTDGAASDRVRRPRDPVGNETGGNGLPLPPLPPQSEVRKGAKPPSPRPLRRDLRLPEAESQVSFLPGPFRGAHPRREATFPPGQGV